jgi:hypothetical protein
MGEEEREEKPDHIQIFEQIRIRWRKREKNFLRG